MFSIQRVPFLLAAFLSLSLLLTVAVEAGDLHLLLVGDGSAADLKDSIRVDLKRIESHVENVAHFTGLQLHTHRFPFENVTSGDVLSAIKDLNTNIDDVVIFYFSGHGYRTPSKNNIPWPNIYLSKSQTGIDLIDVSERLSSKSARLVLVIADCCNNSLPNHAAPPLAKKIGVYDHKSASIGNNYRRLFLDTEGLIVMASSRAGQASWTMQHTGSFYTKAYISTIEAFMQKPVKCGVDWDIVLKEATYKTYKSLKKCGVTQEPIYHLEVRDVNI